MAKGKQTKLSDKKKVIKAKLEDPELSLRDIEKKTWVSKSVVKTVIDNVPEIVSTSSDKWASIMESIDDIIEKSTSIARKHLKVLNDKERVDTKDVKTATEIGESFFKKKQLLEWKPTEITNTKIDLTPLTPKQLEEMKNQYL